MSVVAPVARGANAGLSILQRQLLALNGDHLVLDEWSERFVADVCWRKPETLSERQVRMVQVLCWRQREHLPAELVPAVEPKLPGADARDRRPMPRQKPRRPRP